MDSLQDAVRVLDHCLHSDVGFRVQLDCQEDLNGLVNDVNGLKGLNGLEGGCEWTVCRVLFKSFIIACIQAFGIGVTGLKSRIQGLGFGVWG